MAPSWILRLAIALAASHVFVASVSAQTAASSEPTIHPISKHPCTNNAYETNTNSIPLLCAEVGAGGFKFTPQSLTGVAIGDVISFEFYLPPDDSVARADVQRASVPYESTGQGKIGFWSGTQVVKVADPPSHWNLTINSTEPIFFYCAAPGSCKTHRMVGAINPNAMQTLQAQINAATIGISVGGAAFLILCATLFFFVGRSKSLKEMVNRQNATVRGYPMSRYGSGGLQSHVFQTSSAQIQSSPEPYSAGQPDYGFNAPPQYGQHHVADQHPSGWASTQQGRVSTTSSGSGVGRQQTDNSKYLRSPTVGQFEFATELEAPNK
ncbi:hypothetical protein EJ02DRAFT_505553 [Clathrospora elynae]|uniref:Extracellular serine-rich protein n=1 Tax=Clathrospora elynae TaxID=706981 RepID=A0A6A5SLG5_9PLEO|nr:hypothetical protein EJ02DRAFT_505553 [Clathrospora elynae]